MAPTKTVQTTNEEFLAACFKYAVEKPRIDFEKLSVAIGMSSGGAANKLRNIMKKWEDDGDVFWTDKEGSAAPATPTKKTPVKRKAPVKKAAPNGSTKKSDLSKADADSDADASEVEKPKKKARGRPATKKTVIATSGVDTDEEVIVHKEVDSGKPELNMKEVAKEDDGDEATDK